LESEEKSLPPHQHAHPPASSHFMGEEGNTPKPLCIGSYNKSMGFVDVNDMINSNSISFNL